MPVSMLGSSLKIYLNDHLAGATGGRDLAVRVARAHRGTADAATLARLRTEVSEDREALLSIMAALVVPVRQYKLVAVWAAEKLSRVKLNGHLLSRSPLSNLVELEALQLGVHGKAGGWRTLRVLADSDTRLRAHDLDDLLLRAQEQEATLEELRIRTATLLLDHRGV